MHQRTPRRLGRLEQPVFPLGPPISITLTYEITASPALHRFRDGFRQQQPEVYVECSTMKGHVGVICHVLYGENCSSKGSPLGFHFPTHTFSSRYW